MSSWANIAKKNISNKLDDKPISQLEQQLNNTNDKDNNQLELLRNRHVCSVSEIYNTLLDKLNNGYFTVLSIDISYRREQFINMIFRNFNINYHIKYDNIYSDSDINDNLNSDDESEFVPTYSKFAYL
jgi:hypothetical protein